MEDKLHIGCFNVPAEGWHNTDVTPHLWLARLPGAAPLLHAVGKLSDERIREHRAGIFRRVHYLDVTKRFPYKDDTFRAAFCSHVLEHIARDSVAHFFQEVRRVLRPGGIFRVVVPSLEIAIAEYRPDAPEACLEAIFENRHSWAKNVHKWMYTRESLARTFEENGFVSVSKEAFRTGRMPDLNSLDNRPENSIYVEGQKAGAGSSNGS
jgi:predicted SAM-dependent methyltransferase